MAVYGLKDPNLDADVPKDATHPSAVQPDAPEDHVPTRRRSSSSSNYLRLRATITHNLRSALTSRENTTLWEAARHSQASAGGHTSGVPGFRVTFVDNDFTLPPRKPTSYQQPVLHPHSALSPLSTQSPLHPDGIMTPQWYEKHRNLYPSTVVGFYDLWDWSIEPGNPARPKREVGPLAGHTLADPMEKERDASMAHGINEKRKYFHERGVKFAAVIILNPRHTDDPAIEDRLASLRKLSGLDSKNSLFVLPVSTQTDATEFLNKSLYESAQVYYSNHVKRIRKKLSRLPSPSVAVRQVTPQTAEGPQPLSVPGWVVRYEYKLAVFQEFRQDIQGAVKSYDASYNMLLNMLQPNSGDGSMKVKSNRWREAWTLADCMNIKSNAGSPSLGSSPFLGSSGGHANQLDGGISPGELLQHAGFYFHLAAMCSAERRRRYIEIAKWKDSESKADDPTYLGAMGLLAEEEQVDHSALTIELLTKGYEQFKKYRNTRMTLYLAAEIAGTYYEAGKFEMALKFFERIGKTYRKESWHTVLTSILRWSLRCAKELNMNGSVINYLVELLCDDLPMSDDKRLELQNDLQDVLTGDAIEGNDASEEPLVISMDDINSFLTCHIQCETSSGFVNQPMRFQITLSTNKQSPPQPIDFKSLQINFSNAQWNQIYLNNSHDDDGADQDKDFCFYDCTNSEHVQSENHWMAHSNLQFRKGQCKVFEGMVTLDHSETLKMENVILELNSTGRQTFLSFNIANRVHDTRLAGRRKWYKADGSKPVFLSGRGELSTFDITQQPSKLVINSKHYPPALVDEHYPVSVTLTNEESASVEAIIRVEIKAIESQDLGDKLKLLPTDDDQSATSILDIDIGQIDANGSKEQTLYVVGRTTPLSRILNISVRYKPCSSNQESYFEKHETLKIHYNKAFEIKFHTHEQESNYESGLDFPPNLEVKERLLVIAAVRCTSPWNLQVVSIDTEQDAQPSHATVHVQAMPKARGDDEKEWKKDQVFNSIHLFELSTADRTASKRPVDFGALIIKWRRVSHVHEEMPLCQTSIAFPPLSFSSTEIRVHREHPSEIYIGEALVLSYTITNPTSQFAELQAQIEVSDAFVFSGYKQTKFRVLPYSSQIFQYHCHPILAGHVRLPRLKVEASNGSSGEVTGTTTDAIVYVKPRRQ
ncbi:hypothetical protein Unana1_03972 [Umbelopsis nana]